MPDWIAGPAVAPGAPRPPASLSQQRFEARCAALIAASSGMARGWTESYVTMVAESFERWLLRPEQDGER